MTVTKEIQRLARAAKREFVRTGDDKYRSSLGYLKNPDHCTIYDAEFERFHPRKLRLGA